jgi:deoxyhypusine synthase
MIYFHVMKRPGFVIDIVGDVARLNSSAVFARKTGMVILGGGVIKHHICNANLMRNGADYAVFVNTAADYDGSDSGATPNEAISWGKLRANARHVKLHGDASLLFPLLVARAFATPAPMPTTSAAQAVK